MKGNEGLFCVVVIDDLFKRSRCGVSLDPQRAGWSREATGCCGDKRTGQFCTCR